MHTTRRHVRSLCADLVTIEWIDQAGHPTSQSALLEDISPGGACLNVDRSVPVGADAIVKQGDWQAACHVVYCQLREIGFFVGLQFKRGSDWSKNSFLPRHLLELAKFLQESHQD